jgi:FkbH-like protein
VSDGPNSLLETLEHGSLDLAEVTRLVSELEKSSTKQRTLRFGITSNVTVDLLGTFLRKQALLYGQRAVVHVGSFDDHLGNLKRFSEDGTDAIVLLNLFDALVPSFEARLPHLGVALVSERLEQFRGELGLGFAAARGVKHVFASLVHRLAPPGACGETEELDEAIARFNEVIRSEAARFENVHVISTAAIASRLGWNKAHDMRSYWRFRAPFTSSFLDGFADAVYRLCRGFGAYYYKALVLDCDNTLWGGTLGEDLTSGIQLSSHGYPGCIYWQVQHEYLALQRRGVLLCLCTKNNQGDVDEMLASHPEMVLRDEHFVTKRVNWKDKVTNLRDIAGELGVGLESFVFVDDSSFECEAIRSQLPMVKTLQVPKNLYEYPRLVATVKDLFITGSISAESAAKTEQYRLRAQADAARQQFTTQEEYLASLNLKVTVRRNDASSAPRIAELTQKSNQFNLTTHRYLDAEIRNFMESESIDVYSIHVADKFGDSGLTGVVIVTYEANGLAAVDTLLLSCRILGRDVERSFWGAILERAKDRGCGMLTAQYLPTSKNAQVCDFWDRLGLDLATCDTTGHRVYTADLSRLVVSSPAHIEVMHAF